MAKQEVDILYYHFSGCLRVRDWEEVLLLFVTICYNLSALEDGKLGYQT